MKFTLRQLEVYVATAHTENLTQAAQELALSQSAASEALKSLENQFDVKLFDRAGKRLQLNSLGKQLQPQAEKLLEQARHLEGLLSNPEGEQGSITVGATLSVGNYLGIQILSHFQQKHPHTRVKLEVANTQSIAEKLLNFELDLGMVEGEVSHPDLEVTPWREDELVVFCAPNHPLAQQGKLDDKDLLASRWILREQGSGTRQAFEAIMRGLMPKLDIALELQHTEAIKRAVEAGLGLGCLSRMTLQEAFKRGNLLPLEVPQRDFRRTLYLVCHQQKYQTEALSRWLTLCWNDSKTPPTS